MMRNMPSIPKELIIIFGLGLKNKKNPIIKMSDICNVCGEEKISMRRGDSLPIQLELTDDETGTPIDITGSTLYFTVKKRKTDEDIDALIQKIVTVHDDPTAGITSFEVAPADTLSIELGDYYFDIQLVLNGTVSTILVGEFELLYDITKTY